MQSASNNVQETVDLAELGRSYTPPQALDTTPEVSDVIAEMPWWAARGLLYIIISFIIAALLWAYFSEVDMVVAARGALVPEGYVKPVQSVGGGTVQYLFVREGETVERGQALLQLDSTEMRTRLMKLRQELETSRSQLRQLRTKAPVTETLEQENRIARLESDASALELGLRQTTVTAPASGILTTLDVRGPGAVLQPGQQIGTIAPAGTRLLVEAQVPNKDMTFIETGLTAKLKFDSFPYQDYGTVDGSIIYVSPDAQVSEESGSFYKVLIAPEQTSVKAKGKDIALRPGLSLTAEIVTDRKSILNLLLEPFSQLKSGQ
jgi:multidrug efflux pump subunit AcrA (membrane-fusion protein)